MNTISKIILSNSITIPFTYYFATHNTSNDSNNVDTKIILKDDISSKTTLSVTKQILNTWDTETINVYENEKKWLKQLHKTDIIAKPLLFDDQNRMVVTEYSGEKITKANLPTDWESQRDHILQTLKENNCRHNDIKPDELLVHKNKIKIIDFGWANESDTNNPTDWPTGLGAEFKCEPVQSNMGFDDKCSFNKSIQHILNR